MSYGERMWPPDPYKDIPNTREGSEDSESPPRIAPKDPDIYLPIYVMTGIFGAIFIIFPLLIPKGPNQGLIRCCIWISTFAMWLFWFTVYVAQMNPLVGPKLKNTTYAWLSQAWNE